MVRSISMMIRDLPNISKDLAKHAADRILTKIESKGMLPPSKTYIIEYSNKGMLKGIKKVLDSHKWDKR